MEIQSHKRFGFGKYRGRTVGEVAQFDPTYIWWVENNTEHRFTPRVKRVARNARDAQLGFTPAAPAPRFY